MPQPIYDTVSVGLFNDAENRFYDLEVIPQPNTQYITEVDSIQRFRIEEQWFIPVFISSNQDTQFFEAVRIDYDCISSVAVTKTTTTLLNEEVIMFLAFNNEIDQQ